MGLIEVSTDDNGNAFIHYATKENEINLHFLDLAEKYLYAKISIESECIKRWAQNLRQTPEIYMTQLINALEEQKVNVSVHKLDETSTQEDGDRPPDTKIPTKQNSFELDSGNNLIWKKCFEQKNIYGRKGKFLLEEKPRRRGLEILMSSLITESSDQEKRIQCYISENKRLLKEKDDLRQIADESVRMKEKFEREIYGKFTSLLNAKKIKNCQLRDRFAAIKGAPSSKQPRPLEAPSSNHPQATGALSNNHPQVLVRLTQSTSAISDDDFDADTDVDSPDDATDEERDQGDGGRRRVRTVLGDMGVTSPVPLKKPKTRINMGSGPEDVGTEVEPTFSQNSPDLLDSSMESDLKVGLAGRNSRLY